MAQSNRIVVANEEPEQVVSQDGTNPASIRPYQQAMPDGVAGEGTIQPTIVSQRKKWLSRLLISLVVLPLPLLTVIIVMTQPQFEHNLQARNASATFFIFLILLGLFAYHAFMFWYDPFVVEDDDLTRRKERVVNALSLAFSIPGVGGLIFTFITGTSSTAELSLIEQLAQRFPLQLWTTILMLLILLGWLIWLGFNHVPPVQNWARRLHSLDSGPITQLRHWLGHQWQRLHGLWVRWRVRIILLVSSFLSIGLLMSILVNFLRQGIGLDWAVAAVLTALFLIQIAGTLAVRLVSPPALIWCNGATFTLLFAVEQLTRRGTLIAGDRVLSHWIAWAVIIEVLAVYALLVRQMRRRVPRGFRARAITQAF